MKRLIKKVGVIAFASSICLIHVSNSSITDSGQTTIALDIIKDMRKIIDEHGLYKATSHIQHPIQDPYTSYCACFSCGKTIEKGIIGNDKLKKTISETLLSNAVRPYVLDSADDLKAFQKHLTTHLTTIDSPDLGLNVESLASAISDALKDRHHIEYSIINQLEHSFLSNVQKVLHKNLLTQEASAKRLNEEVLKLEDNDLGRNLSDSLSKLRVTSKIIEGLLEVASSISIVYKMMDHKSLHIKLKNMSSYSSALWFSGLWGTSGLGGAMTASIPVLPSAYASGLLLACTSGLLETTRLSVPEPKKQREDIIQECRHLALSIMAGVLHATTPLIGSLRKSYADEEARLYAYKRTIVKEQMDQLNVAINTLQAIEDEHSVISESTDLMERIEQSYPSETFDQLNKVTDLLKAQLLRVQEVQEGAPQLQRQALAKVRAQVGLLWLAIGDLQAVNNHHSVIQESTNLIAEIEGSYKLKAPLQCDNAIGLLKSQILEIRAAQQQALEAQLEIAINDLQTIDAQHEIIGQSQELIQTTQASYALGTLDRLTKSIESLKSQIRHVQTVQRQILENRIQQQTTTLQTQKVLQEQLQQQALQAQQTQLVLQTELEQQAQQALQAQQTQQALQTKLKQQAEQRRVARKDRIARKREIERLKKEKKEDAKDRERRQNIARQQASDRARKEKEKSETRLREEFTRRLHCEKEAHTKAIEQAKREASAQRKNDKQRQKKKLQKLKKQLEKQLEKEAQERRMLLQTSIIQQAALKGGQHLVEQEQEASRRRILEQSFRLDQMREAGRRIYKSLEDERAHSTELAEAANMLVENIRQLNQRLGIAHLAENPPMLPLHNDQPGLTTSSSGSSSSILGDTLPSSCSSQLIYNNEGNAAENGTLDESVSSSEHESETEHDGPKTFISPSGHTSDTSSYTSSSISSRSKSSNDDTTKGSPEESNAPGKSENSNSSGSTPHSTSSGSRGNSSNPIKLLVLHGDSSSTSSLSGTISKSSNSQSTYINRNKGDAEGVSVLDGGHNGDEYESETEYDGAEVLAWLNSRTSAGSAYSSSPYSASSSSSSSSSSYSSINQDHIEGGYTGDYVAGDEFILEGEEGEKDPEAWILAYKLQEAHDNYASHRSKECLHCNDQGDCKEHRTRK